MNSCLKKRLHGISSVLSSYAKETTIHAVKYLATSHKVRYFLKSKCKGIRKHLSPRSSKGSFGSQYWRLPAWSSTRLSNSIWCLSGLMTSERKSAWDRRDKSRFPQWSFTGKDCRIRWLALRWVETWSQWKTCQKRVTRKSQKRMKIDTRPIFPRFSACVRIWNLSGNLKSVEFSGIELSCFCISYTTSV